MNSNSFTTKQVQWSLPSTILDLTKWVVGVKGLTTSRLILESSICCWDQSISVLEVNVVLDGTGILTIIVMDWQEGCTDFDVILQVFPFLVSMETCAWVMSYLFFCIYELHMLKTAPN